MKLLNDLKAIKEEGQIVSNTYVLNQVVYKMPCRYQESFSIVKEEKLGRSTNTLWSITSEFLKSQATRLDRDLPWLLKNSSESDHKNLPSPSSHGGPRQLVN